MSSRLVSFEGIEKRPGPEKERETGQMRAAGSVPPIRRKMAPEIHSWKIGKDLSHPILLESDHNPAGLGTLAINAIVATPFQLMYWMPALHPVALSTAWFVRFGVGL